MSTQRRTRTFLVDTEWPIRKGDIYGPKQRVTVRVRGKVVADAKRAVMRASKGHAVIFGVRE